MKQPLVLWKQVLLDLTQHIQSVTFINKEKTGQPVRDNQAMEYKGQWKMSKIIQNKRVQLQNIWYFPLIRHSGESRALWTCTKLNLILQRAAGFLPIEHHDPDSLALWLTSLCTFTKGSDLTVGYGGCYITSGWIADLQYICSICLNQFP